MAVIPRNDILYKKALKLRKSGKSYNQISKKLRIPKSTISNWLSDKKWSETIKIQLADKNKLKNSNFLVKLNALKHLSTLKRHDEYKKKARLEYDKLKHNKLFLAGLSIYWGEGEKTNSGRVSLVNSDDRMLKVVINFYRKTLKIPEDKLRAALFIYKDIDENKAIKYWSKILNVNKKNFVKTQILPSRSKLTQNKVSNGMCNIYFSNTETNVKIREWISLLANDMRD